MSSSYAGTWMSGCADPGTSPANGGTEAPWTRVAGRWESCCLGGKVSHEHLQGLQNPGLVTVSAVQLCSN